MSTILILVLTSCTTSPTNIDLPDLNFPTFPDHIQENQTVVTLKNDVVSMPFWYWKQIEIYAIKNDTVKEKYDFLRKIYK